MGQFIVQTYLLQQQHCNIIVTRSTVAAPQPLHQNRDAFFIFYLFLSRSNARLCACPVVVLRNYTVHPVPAQILAVVGSMHVLTYTKKANYYNIMYIVTYTQRGADGPPKTDNFPTAVALHETSIGCRLGYHPKRHSIENTSRLSLCQISPPVSIRCPIQKI